MHYDIKALLDSYNSRDNLSRLLHALVLYCQHVRYDALLENEGLQATEASRLEDILKSAVIQARVLERSG